MLTFSTQKSMFVNSPVVEKTPSSSPVSSCCLQLKSPLRINTSGALDATINAETTIQRCSEQE